MWAWKDKIQLKGDKTLWYVIIGLAIAVWGVIDKENKNG